MNALDYAGKRVLVVGDGDLTFGGALSSGLADARLADQLSDPKQLVVTTRRSEAQLQRMSAAAMGTIAGLRKRKTTVGFGLQPDAELPRGMRVALGT